MKQVSNLLQIFLPAVRAAAWLLVIPGFLLAVSWSPHAGHLLMLAGTLLQSLDLEAEFQATRYNSRVLRPA
jgi:Zn-dependent membrane protease YugP